MFKVKAKAEESWGKKQTHSGSEQQINLDLKQLRGRTVSQPRARTWTPAFSIPSPNFILHFLQLLQFLIPENTEINAIFKFKELDFILNFIADLLL